MLNFCLNFIIGQLSRLRLSPYPRQALELLPSATVAGSMHGRGECAW